MSTFSLRVEKLIESTIIPEVRKEAELIAGMAKYAPVRHLAKRLVESIEGFVGKDASVKNFVGVERRLLMLQDMGIEKGLESIKESGVANHPVVRGIIQDFDSIIKKGVPDYQVVEGFLKSFLEYQYDSTVNETIAGIRKTYEYIAEDILIQRALDHYIAENNKRGTFFVPVIEKLENYQMNITGTNRTKLINELNMFMFDGYMRSFVDALKVFESRSGKFELKTATGHVNVRTPYSFVLTEKKGRLIVIDRELYMVSESGIMKFETDAAKKYSDFIEVNNYLNQNHVSVNGDSVSVVLGDQVVEVRSDGTLRINEREITYRELTDVISVSGILGNNYNKDLFFIGNVMENMKFLVEVDFAKIIESTVDTGNRAVIFKYKNNLYLNQKNVRLNENKFLTNLNATQARNIVRKSLKYDLSEGLSEYLDKEDREKTVIRDEIKNTMDAIIDYEQNIDKIDLFLTNESMLIDEDEADKLRGVRDDLAGRVEDLKSRYQHLDAKLEAYEMVPEDEFDVDLGDRVSVSNRGNGKVIGVNMVEQTALVLFDSGEQGFIPLDDVTSMEGEIQNSMAANDPIGTSMTANTGEVTDPLDFHIEFEEDSPEHEESETPEEEEEEEEEEVVESVNEEKDEEENNDEDDESEEDDEEDDEKEEEEEETDDDDIKGASRYDRRSSSGGEKKKISESEVVGVDVENTPKTVMAKVDIQFPARYRGDKVRVVAKDFTSAGMEDPVEIIQMTGARDMVPKKYLTLLETYHSDRVAGEASPVPFPVTTTRRRNRRTKG